MRFEKTYGHGVIALQQLLHLVRREAIGRAVVPEFLPSPSVAASMVASVVMHAAMPPHLPHTPDLAHEHEERDRAQEKAKNQPKKDRADKVLMGSLEVPFGHDFAVTPFLVVGMVGRDASGGRGRSEGGCRVCRIAMMAMAMARELGRIVTKDAGFHGGRFRKQ